MDGKRSFASWPRKIISRQCLSHWDWEWLSESALIDYIWIPKGIEKFDQSTGKQISDIFFRNSGFVEFQRLSQHGFCSRVCHMLCQKNILLAAILSSFDKVFIERVLNFACVLCVWALFVHLCSLNIEIVFVEIQNVFVLGTLARVRRRVCVSMLLCERAFVHACACVRAFVRLHPWCAS